MTRFVYSPHYVVNIGDHVFPTRKFGLVAERLKDLGEFIEPQPASRRDLLLAHEQAWVDKALKGVMSLDDETLMELPFSRDLALAHRLSVSGTIMACGRALDYGVGLHIGGGSHHAFADHGEGFCMFNDIAVGIIKMRHERGISRASVVDLDVHQGNGTAALFANEPDVFTFSMHQEDIYPQPKAAGSLDIGLAAGVGDKAYLKSLEANLPKVFEHEQELVVYQAGVDCYEGDVLGGLKLTAQGLRRRDQMVYQECRRRGVGVAVTLGGGYAQDLSQTAALHAQTLLIFAGLEDKILK